MLSDLFGKVILASQSPARRKLLEDQGIEVVAKPQDCDEKTSETHPGKVVQALAMLKLQSFLKSADRTLADDGTPVIASDTLLWSEGRFIGKAHSDDEAREQISSLQGKTHQVYSGYAVLTKRDGVDEVVSGWDCADVAFKAMDSAWVDSYVASGEWKGAAGSYHLYGRAVDFVASISGDEATVIGLPLKALENRLKHNCIA